MPVSSLLLFAGALIAAAGPPGPTVAALVARVISGGFRNALPFVAAIWIGEAIWLSLAIFGLAFVARTFEFAFSMLKWAGIVYLLYLAWRMWTAPADLQKAEMPRRDSPAQLFLAGLAVALGNPNNMMFYMALLPTIINLHSVTLAGWAELMLTMALVLVAIDLCWAFAATKARAVLKSPRAVRMANRISAATMAGAAAAIAAR